MRIVKELIGKEVLNADVTIMGKVVDLDVDFENETLEALIVSKGGIQETLNISKSEYVIPLDMVSTIGDKIILESAFFENEDLNQMEKEIQDLKSQL